ncbi:androgen-dependent TFPI-regulating protein-like [Neocloeon triangulifer]|uniref:androgen-dependent TFPI-regulating protein-like n=1 Tax=Neocloeon triangulifer TaxID=2078957 RepID=UPI00286F717D|nr:androgen-dependent TFPI-regulating protein-like [Neocloeon triangulifer]
MIEPAAHSTYGFLSGVFVEQRKMSFKGEGLKHHCLTFFHGSVVTYYALVDFHMALANYEIYQTDHPVTKMWLGGATQFYTTWNQVFHQLYFVLSLIQDILTYSTNNEHIKFCSWFDSIKYKFFIPIMLPSTFMTTINFWSIYWIAPHLMLADLIEFIPPWLNHAVHTFVTPIIIAEFIITSHGIPSWWKGFKYVTILMAAYAGWIYPLGYFLGQWPYPFLEVFNLTQHIFFCPTMFIHGYFWYIIFRYAEQHLYGEYSTRNSPEKKGA